jgi:hypothetical protein
MLVAIAVQSGLAASPSPEAAQPTLAIAGKLLTATNLTPKGMVFILGLTRQVIAYQPRFDHIEVARTIDADGTFRLEMMEAAPLTSLWLLVDVASGRSIVSSPSGFTPLKVPMPKNALKSNGLGELRHIEAAIDYAEVVWIRPGTGVWQTIAADGGPRDADLRTDGKTSLSVDAMKAVADSPEHPKKFEKGDVVFLADPAELTWFITEVGK